MQSSTLISSPILRAIAAQLNDLQKFKLDGRRLRDGIYNSWNKTLRLNRRTWIFGCWSESLTTWSGQLPDHSFCWGKFWSLHNFYDTQMIRYGWTPWSASLWTIWLVNMWSSLVKNRRNPQTTGKNHGNAQDWAGLKKKRKEPIFRFFLSSSGQWKAIWCWKLCYSLPVPFRLDKSGQPPVVQHESKRSRRCWNSFLL